MRIAVLGLGLIGGSAALALADQRHEVLGYDPDPAVREAARRHFAVTGDDAALLDSDLAVVAAPYRHIARISAETLPAGRYTGLITDVASVKGTVARAFAGHERYVGGHPMAGKETAGFAAAEPGLFGGRKWVLCLESDTDLRDWIDLARLWTSIGAHIVPATAQAHDRAAARISHLEHLVAAALVRVSDDPLSRALAAGSFRDGTRVAASPTALFSGMVEGNRAELLAALEDFGVELDEARRSAGADRPEAIADWFEHSRASRASWPPEPGGAERMPITREALLELGAEGGWVEEVALDEVALVRRPRVKSTP